MSHNFVASKSVFRVILFAHPCVIVIVISVSVPCVSCVFTTQVACVSRCVWSGLVWLGSEPDRRWVSVSWTRANVGRLICLTDAALLSSLPRTDARQRPVTTPGPRRHVYSCFYIECGKCLLILFQLIYITKARQGSFIRNSFTFWHFLVVLVLNTPFYKNIIIKLM